MTETPWPDAELAKLAALADEPADAVIDALAAKVAKSRGRQRDPAAKTRQAMFPELLRAVRRDTNDAEMDPRVAGFLLAGDEIDGEMDKDLVRHAQAFFGEHGVAIITALFHAALPEAYLGRRGVQVLDMTGELVSNWSRRIQETGQFLINVMSPAPYLVRLNDSTSLSAGEFGAVAIRRVRLTHAAVRWLLSDLDERTRDLDFLLANVSSRPLTRWEARMIEIGEDEQPPKLADGATEAEAAGPAEAAAEAVAQALRVTSRPLNQEDLLATLGTFTTVMFAALEKLAVPISGRDREAFHHLWNVVAWHLGIGDAQTLGGIDGGRPPAWPANKILPLGVEEMDSLYRRLAQRLQESTEQGRRLTKTLVQELTYPLPRPLQGAPEFIVRYFIGAAHADDLDVGRGGYAELVIRHSGVLERVARRAPSSLVGRATFRPISQLVTRYALRAFVAQSRGNDRGVAIARPIAGQWGIQMGSEVRAPRS
jgi:ER-bound oxygenase mpaB/B'/Rubber oxygenase, catalytic domain